MAVTDPTAIDFLERARGHLLSQWGAGANIDLMLQFLFGDEAGALDAGWQHLDDVLLSLLPGRRLDTAVGTQLDNAGVIVGQTRMGGESDAAYQIKIAAAMLRNRSDGTATELYDVIKALISSKFVTANVIDTGPAAYTIHISTSGALTADEIAAVVEFVEDTDAAGVGDDGITTADGAYFGWDGDPNPLAVGFNDGGFVTVL